MNDLSELVLCIGKVGEMNGKRAEVGGKTGDVRSKTRGKWQAVSSIPTVYEFPF